MSIVKIVRDDESLFTWKHDDINGNHRGYSTLRRSPPPQSEAKYQRKKCPKTRRFGVAGHQEQRALSDIYFLCIWHGRVWSIMFVLVSTAIPSAYAQQTSGNSACRLMARGQATHQDPSLLSCWYWEGWCSWQAPTAAVECGASGSAHNRFTWTAPHFRLHQKHFLFPVANMQKVRVGRSVKTIFCSKILAVANIHSGIELCCSIHRSNLFCVHAGTESWPEEEKPIWLNWMQQ